MSSVRFPYFSVVILPRHSRSHLPAPPVAHLGGKGVPRRAPCHFLARSLLVRSILVRARPVVARPARIPVRRGARRGGALPPRLCRRQEAGPGLRRSRHEGEEGPVPDGL